MCSELPSSMAESLLRSRAWICITCFWCQQVECEDLKIKSNFYLNLSNLEKNAVTNIIYEHNKATAPKKITNSQWRWLAQSSKSRYKRSEEVKENVSDHQM